MGLCACVRNTKWKYTYILKANGIIEKDIVAHIMASKSLFSNSFNIILDSNMLLLG